MEENTEQLGGNIELVGFSSVERDASVIIKKMVGTYAKNFAELVNNFQQLKVTLKAVHETQGSKKYELHGFVMCDGGPHTSEHTDRNLFVALDKILSSIETIMKK